MNLSAPYRDPERVLAAAEEIRKQVSRPWVLMEICGGQTHAILRHGLDQLLPNEIELVHGPGCPVCVTPLELIDKALAIAETPGVIFTSFGDMLRVPGSQRDLFSIRASGGDVRVVYSPLDALKIAREYPDRQVVFFGIGFETTAPANAMALLQAKTLGIENFSMLVSHVRVPPAIHTILSAQNSRINGFLLAGHVCTVMGYWEYPSIAEQYQVPMAVTGFEPLDIVNGIKQTIEMLESGSVAVANAYPRVVTYDGNQEAQAVINRVFEPCDRKWRGIGMISDSGWGLRHEFSDYNAETRFDVGAIQSQESPLCIAGEVLQGLRTPDQCAAFGKICTPNSPLGAPMVSAEGACAAYYRYKLVSN